MGTITVLSDNGTSTFSSLMNRLRGEWGFSALIDHGGHRILYDTGLSGDVLLHNMKALNIQPGSVDTLILSHNHIDHTGGVMKFLESAGPEVKVLAHPTIFRRTLINVGSGFHDIGPDFSESQLRQACGEFMPVVHEFRLSDDLIVSGEIPRSWGPTHNRFIYDSNGAEDPIADDLALYIETDHGLIVLTGCGHAGVENVLEYGLSLTGEDKIMGVIGGLHLMVYDYRRIGKAVQNILDKDPEFVVPSHCTGNLVDGLIYSGRAKAYRPGGVGTVVNF